MARVIEFDPEQALADAMKVFWRCGFNNTSMEDIVTETGVNRHSLYGTFGNKKALLVAALRHYETSMRELMWTDLRKPDAGRAEILDFWQSLREHAEEEGFCDGCLIVNLASEVAPHEPEIATEVQRINNEHAATFAAAIRNGQKNGDISPDVDADGAGRMLVSLSRGLALMLRSGAKAPDLDGAIDAGLSILKTPE
ncbi:MAG: TetR/AcrR family transcriptional regulator [Alphaproteobacteria bacterium]|jgi:TetR/AcrR family transcriptional regulator, transcriptional repressor for nem operon|nr:TetR/AcrR family transcriptional regulator [Alphaproteobacteria bacterium]MBT7942027.1 TetR/AcrR family transcriptional regulator [Alphaproteobacteria bacterium]